jgi:biotin-(acetyl-CoA carboxylase) ligase
VVAVSLNINENATPPMEELTFPATSLEKEGLVIDRFELLHDILVAFIKWRAKLGEPDFIHAWEEALAFRSEQVQVWNETEESHTGILLGIEADGSLRLDSDGKILAIRFGEVHLSPV